MAFDFGDSVNESSFSQILDMDDGPDDRMFSQALVFDFFTQAEDTFKKIDKALADGDLHQVSKEGHFLKGSSATLGFVKLQDHCQMIEQYAKMMNLDGTSEPDKEACVERVTAALAAAKENIAVLCETMEKFFGVEK